MKRTKSLVMLLAVAMLVFGLVATASAAVFPDTVGTNYAADVAKLSGLGVINGYPDGTFKPDNSITRAEFAKMADVLAGLKTLGEGSKNVVRFKDVPAGQWYTGWVAVAASREFVKGYPDGTFKPDANITQAEVITVIMRILGYNDNLTGSWPYDYLSEAAKIGLTDDITLDASANATRAVVATLMSKALDETVVEYDSDKNKFEKKTVKINNNEYEEVTLLDDVFEGRLIEDAFALDWRKNGDTFQLRVSYKQSNDGYKLDDSNSSNGVEEAWIDVADDVFIDGAANVPGLEGKIVDYIYNKDDKEITFVAVKDYGIKLSDEADLTFNNGVLTRVKIDGTNYDVNSDAIAWYYVSSASGGYINVDDLDTTAGVLTVSGSVYKWDPERIIAVLNEDGDIVGLAGKTMGRPAVASEVTSNKRIKVETSGTQSIPTDLNESDTDYIVIKDGKIVDLSEIKAGDLVWVYNNGHGANLNKGMDYRILVSSKYVEGKLDEINSSFSSVTLSGKKYDAFAGAGFAVSTDNGDNFSTVTAVYQVDSDLFDTTVKLYFDPLGFGRVLVGDTEGTASGNSLYGVVTDYTISSSVNSPKVTEIEILKADNTKVVYKTNSDSNDRARDTALVSGNRVAKDFEIGSFVKFTLTADNYIKGFEVIRKTKAGTAPANGELSGNLTDVDDDTDRVLLNSTWYKAKNTVVFDCSAADSDDWEVISYKDVEDYLSSNSSNDILNVAYHVDDNVIDYLVIGTAVAGSGDYAMVMGKGYNADGAYIKLNINGTVKAYNTTVNLAAYAEGSLVTYDISGGDVTSLNEVVDENATHTRVVGGIDTDDNEIRLDVLDAYGQVVSSKWYKVDSDTVIFDWSDQDGDPAYITINDVADGDKVVFAADGKDVLTYLVLVEN